MADTSVLNDDVLGINRQDRVHVLIDAAYMMGMLRNMERKINYKSFLAWLRDSTRLVRASYFMTVREDMDARTKSVMDMVDYAGYDVVRKWGYEVQEQGGFYRFKGSVIPEMTVAMVEAAENGIDHLVVLTGDGDFLAGVNAAKAKGSRVTLLAQKESTSDDLRRASDSFVDFATLPDELFLPPSR